MSLLESLNPDLPSECDKEEGEVGAWGFSPNHMMLMMFVPIPFVLFLSKRVSKGQPLAISADKDPKPRLWLLAAILALDFSLVIYHKLQKPFKGDEGFGRHLVYLVQPCHIVHLLLIFCSLCSNMAAAAAFEVVVAWWYGAVVSLVGNDYSIYTLPLELENCLMQHALLVLVPAYFLATRRFELHGTLSFLACHTLQQCMHYWIYAPLSIASGTNIQFLLCPVPALSWLGALYHVVASYVIFPLAAATMYFGVAPLCISVGDSLRGELKEIGTLPCTPTFVEHKVADAMW
eukprot:Sspe_Gene.35036::Locus_17000_Transcript_1_1_Confidence_1.000_Length_1132::g.35036::m.35036